MTPIVLVVDDEAANRQVLERILVREGYDVRHASNGREALKRLREEPPAVMMTDLKMPGMNGLELLKAARAIAPDLEVIVMTAYGTIESAVEAMKEGAWDFVTKPLRRSGVVQKVHKAIEKHNLIQENRALREELARSAPGDFIFRSTTMQAIIEECRQIADSMASVMITGESGTGKSLLARWIHDASPRRSNRLVTMNCAALPENLLESELFGHEAGAFTGARGQRSGRFELANNGTLFLDEVTEMSSQVQVKLLRVLQDGEYERVGGEQTYQTDVRIIAATNRDPEAAISERQLREDLYYRLNVIRIQLPPLRARTEDIPLLTRHFITRHAARNNRTVNGITADALDALSTWHWPGNVRELENCVERAVVLSRNNMIERNNLPSQIQNHHASPSTLSFPVGTPLKEIERQMIAATLRQVDGDKALAAQLLGITSRTIYRREAEWRDYSE